MSGIKTCGVCGKGVTYTDPPVCSACRLKPVTKPAPTGGDR